MIKYIHVLALLLMHSFELFSMEKIASKTLEQYCNVPQLSLSVHKDLRRALADYIIGRGGWWYPTTLSHPAFISSVAMLPDKNLVATGGENGDDYLGLLRFWKADTHELVHGCLVQPERRMTDGIVKVAYNAVGSRIACALEHKCVLMTAEDILKTSLIGENPVEGQIQVPTQGKIRSVFWNPKKSHAIIVSSVLIGPDGRTDYLNVVDAFTGNIVTQTSTGVYKVTNAGKGFAIHPEGSLFVLATCRKVRFWNDEWEVVRNLEVPSPVCAIAFNKTGALLALMAIDGQIHFFEDINNQSYHAPRSSGSIPCFSGKKDFHELTDMKFHPTKNMIALAMSTGELSLINFDGSVVRSMGKCSVLKEITFKSNGTQLYTVGSNQGPHTKIEKNEAIVWKHHDKPLLEQVLLRLVLKKHIHGCLALCIDPDTSELTKETLVSWMVNRFNLEEEQLKTTWQSMPTKLKESIIKSLTSRVRFGQALEQKHHA